VTDPAKAASISANVFVQPVNAVTK
jgi:hypothetical protein